jgi:LysM repeat protein
MNKTSKFALLVVLVVFLTLTACTLKASKPPAVTPSPSGEAPFPFTTPGVSTFGTQTVIAQTPATTPQVSIFTETPAGQAPGATAPTATPGTQGQTQGQATATSAVVAAINTPVVNRPTTYTLQKGEWPICVARRFDLDLNTFFSNNGLNMGSKPAVGTSLKIPSSGNWNPNFGARALKSHPTTYTVLSGDTIYTIACRYGDVTPEAILAVNSLSSTSAITAGMSLKIP